MSFVRPEAQQTLNRWGEAIIGLVLLCLGAALLATTPILWRFIGCVCGMVGISLVYTGVQRGRLRQSIDGAGVLVAVEGQITYLGPETGGTVALPSITALKYKDVGEGLWRIESKGTDPLDIPANARGAEHLATALAALPAFEVNAMLHAQRSDADIWQLVWKRQSSSSLTEAHRPALQPHEPGA